MIAGVQSKRVLNSHEKRVVAYHEAGHALCGELLPSVDRVHRISIVPRGQGARLHAEPARRGPLPEDARGAARLHDGAARRPGRRADRLRRDHDRRLRRPQEGRRHRPLDGPRLRDGHRRRRPLARRRRAALGDDAADPRRGAPGPDRGSAPRRAAADPRPPRRSSTRSPRSCSSTRCSSATRSRRSCAACRGWSARRESGCGVVRRAASGHRRCLARPAPIARGRRPRPTA